MKKSRSDCVWNLDFTDCWCQKPRSNSAGNDLRVEKRPRPRLKPVAKGLQSGHRSAGFRISLRQSHTGFCTCVTLLLLDHQALAGYHHYGTQLSTFVPHQFLFNERLKQQAFWDNIRRGAFSWLPAFMIFVFVCLSSYLLNHKSPPIQPYSCHMLAALLRSEDKSGYSECSFDLMQTCLQTALCLLSHASLMKAEFLHFVTNSFQYLQLPLFVYGPTFTTPVYTFIF